MEDLYFFDPTSGHLYKALCLPLLLTYSHWGRLVLAYECHGLGSYLVIMGLFPVVKTGI